jgi:ubiquinone biosynthesis UbiH/UbiF/VisC/COQ6 family hydroxylase
VDALAWIVDAAELDTALQAAARFAPHLQTVAAPVEAALTVWADGKASQSVQALGVRVQRHAYGHTAVAARLQCEQGHGNVAWQWFRAPDVLALLPFDRPAVGQGFGLVWSMPAAQAAEVMQLPDAEFEARLLEATEGRVGALRLCAPRAAWPLSLAQADPLCGPGWVLVGDAAHVVHPLAGQGLNLGLADVASLAGVIAAREPWRSVGDEQLLRRHARARALPTLAMARVTDGLLHLFANDQPVVRELRNRGMSLLNHLAPLKRLLTAKALDA